MNGADALFDRARRDFEARSAAVHEARVTLAGRTVLFRFASAALAVKLLKAFRHLPQATSEADLTVCAWEGGSAEGREYELAAAAPAYGLAFADGTVRVAVELASRRLEAYDRRNKTGLFHVPDAEAMPGWEQGAPFLRILHWWASDEGLQLVHGAAVGTPDGAALLVGRGGSGKSTTALASIGSVLQYISDDYCLLETGPTPRVHSIFGSGKADEASARRLPKLEDAFRTAYADPNGKSIIFVAEHAASDMLLSAPLKAIVVPKIAGGTECSAQALPRGEALRALAPSTMFQLPGGRAEALSRMSALLRALPCFRLKLGGDPAAAQPVLHGLLSGAESGHGG